jgi:hypothetical protein
MTIATAPEPRIERYLLRAEQAEEQATYVRDELSRRSWLDLARSWRLLAEQRLLSSQIRAC